MLGLQALHHGGTNLAAYPQAPPNHEKGPERYGLSGLTHVLSTQDSLEANLLKGLDIHTLLSRFASREEYFKTFASPWHDHLVKPSHDKKVMMVTSFTCATSCVMNPRGGLVFKLLLCAGAKLLYF
jgi:hypothetical protein